MGNYISRVGESITNAIKTNDDQLKCAKKRKHEAWNGGIRPTGQHRHNDDDDDGDSDVPDVEQSTAMNDDVDDTDDDDEPEEVLLVVNNDIELVIDNHDAHMSSGQLYEEISRNNTSTTTPTRPTPTSTTTRTNPTNNMTIEKRLKTPMHKKMKSTSKYIYDQLYVNGVNSDITVNALNKSYRLHKIYISQSPYFFSMLSNGNWLESSQTVITIAIPDENINDYSLNIAFGSLYKDDVTIIPNSVVNVLATASLFNLNTLIQECESIMLDNLSYKTVVHYYYASQTYGLKQLLAKTFDWLCMNIMRLNDDAVLCDLSLALFRDIVESNKLVVIQVETDLYTLCKRWLYYQMQTGHKQEMVKNWQKVAKEYFKFYIEHKRLDYLLECEHMHKYHCIFKTIRFNHILSDLSSLRLIKTDRIIPTHWYEKYFYENWLSTLYIDQCFDTKLTEFEMNCKEFDDKCMRFGRILNEDIVYTWRWVGFHYGIDLLVTFMNRSFTIKRNTANILSPYKGLLSSKQKQRIYLMIRVANLDKYGNCKWFKQSDFAYLDLSRNEEKFVLNLDMNVQMPLIMNLHVTSHPNNLTRELFQNSN